MQEILWAEVAKHHGTVAGIASENGRAFSILCNQQKSGRYPDRIDGNTLTYYVGRTTQTHTITALMRVVEEPGPLRVFEKLGPNRWLDHGYWVPAGAEDARDGMIEVRMRRVSPL